MVLTRGRTYFEVPGCQRTHPSQELIAANTELLLRRGDYITPRTYITRIYQLRGDIMRGVNIHVDFVMIQCTKNKKLTPLRINNTYGGMLPCCRPQQLRCFGLRDSFLPLPRVPLLTQLHHVATGPSPRYHGALKFGSLRSQHHIKLPDKLSFIGLSHLSTAIFNSVLDFMK